jgi:hypothetical protein
MYKIQEIEATDFQEQKDISDYERLAPFSSDLASLTALPQLAVPDGISASRWGFQCVPA